MFQALEICGLPGIKGCVDSSQKVDATTSFTPACALTLHRSAPSSLLQRNCSCILAVAGLRHLGYGGAAAAARRTRTCCGRVSVQQRQYRQHSWRWPNLCAAFPAWSLTCGDTDSEAMHLRQSRTATEVSLKQWPKVRLKQWLKVVSIQSLGLNVSILYIERFMDVHTLFLPKTCGGVWRGS